MIRRKDTTITTYYWRISKIQPDHTLLDGWQEVRVKRWGKKRCRIQDFDGSWFTVSQEQLDVWIEIGQMKAEER